LSELISLLLVFTEKPPFVKVDEAEDAAAAATLLRL